MQGALFYRGQNIEIIQELDYDKLAYWYKWHEVCEAEEAKKVQNMIGASGG